MRNPEQNKSNYGVNPQHNSMARNRDWNNTEEYFSSDHDNNFDSSSKYNDYNSSLNDRNRFMKTNSRGYDSNHNTDFSDEGLQSRSHRMQGQNQYQDDYRSGHYGKGPKGYRRSDERIKEDVCEALFAHREIDASSIEVTVKDGFVTLSGSIESRDLKLRIEREVEHLSGIEDVINEIKVMKPSTTSRLS